MKPVPPVPPRLHFHSSWREGAERVGMRLEFDPQTNIWTVDIDGARSQLQIVVRNRKMQPLESLDLYCGCVLDVCGRQTTLQSSDAVTIQWLDAMAWHLSNEYSNLRRQFSKYRSPPKLQHLVARAEAMMRGKSPSQALGGTVMLRGLATAVALMDQELRLVRVEGAPSGEPLGMRNK